jgi:hypothetical protein
MEALEVGRGDARWQRSFRPVDLDSHNFSLGLRRPYRWYEVEGVSFRTSHSVRSRRWSPTLSPRFELATLPSNYSVRGQSHRARRLRPSAIASAALPHLYDLKPAVFFGDKWRSGRDRFFVTIIRKVEDENTAGLDGWAISRRAALNRVFYAPYQKDTDHVS